MNEKHMEIVMGIIMHGGNAKGQAFQAIQLAKEGKFEEAQAAIGASNEALKEAHNTQTSMLTAEANGEHTDVDLYMVHAQDHLMNAITFKDLAVEMIAMEERLQKLEKA